MYECLYSVVMSCHVPVIYFNLLLIHVMGTHICNKHTNSIFEVTMFQSVILLGEYTTRFFEITKFQSYSNLGMFCHDKFMNRIFHITMLQFICWGLYVMMKVWDEMMTSPCFCSSSLLDFYGMTNVRFRKQHVSLCHCVGNYIINIPIR